MLLFLPDRNSDGSKIIVYNQQNWNIKGNIQLSGAEAVAIANMKLGDLPAQTPAWLAEMMDGVLATKGIYKKFSQTAALMLSNYDDEDNISAAE